MSPPRTTTIGTSIFCRPFLVFTLQNNNRHNTSALARKNFPIPNMRPLSIREAPRPGGTARTGVLPPALNPKSYLTRLFVLHVLGMSALGLDLTLAQEKSMNLNIWTISFVGQSVGLLAAPDLRVWSNFAAWFAQNFSRFLYITHWPLSYCVVTLLA